MDATLIHGQPQVLGQRGGVGLEDIEDGGAIERPLADEGHVRLVALLLREVRMLPVLTSNVLRADLLTHVLWNVALYDGPRERRQGGEE